MNECIMAESNPTKGEPPFDALSAFTSSYYTIQRSNDRRTSCRRDRSHDRKTLTSIITCPTFKKAASHIVTVSRESRESDTGNLIPIGVQL